MKKQTKDLARGAMIAALYVVLTYAQNLLFPNSASAPIQFRASEALCVLALFSPAAVGGLTVGCLLFNMTMAGTMPLDMVVGTLATFLAAEGMYHTRNIRIFGYPLPAMLLPALSNGILVGAMLCMYTDFPFWLNFTTVALGEVGVLLTLGSVLYYALRRMDKRLFLA